MIDDNGIIKWGKQFIMIGLGIDNDMFIIKIRIDFRRMDHIYIQQTDHIKIVRSADYIDVGDGDRRYPPPEQPFNRQGAGDGVGIGIDMDQNPIRSGKLFIKSFDFLFIGSDHEKQGPLRADKSTPRVPKVSTPFAIMASIPFTLIFSRVYNFIGNRAGVVAVH